MRATARLTGAGFWAKKTSQAVDSYQVSRPGAAPDRRPSPVSSGLRGSARNFEAQAARTGKNGVFARGNGRDNGKRVARDDEDSIGFNHTLSDNGPIRKHPCLPAHPPPGAC